MHYNLSNLSIFCNVTEVVNKIVASEMYKKYKLPHNCISVQYLSKYTLFFSTTWKEPKCKKYKKYIYSEYIQYLCTAHIGKKIYQNNRNTLKECI